MSESRDGAAWILLGILAFFGLLGLRTDPVPSVVPADAPPATFSAERAGGFVRELARAPHPVGSTEHAAVRDFLLRTLRDLGLDPHVQNTTAARGRTAADVQNVVARMPGARPQGAVALFAHYDSVIGSPGASDDGAGVAVILETLRALSVGRRLENDVLVVFTDAEEVGLFGAAAFVERHPWFDEVRLVLNVEARGSHGGSFMFQTMGPNGRLIRTLAGAPFPVANSVMQEVYERLPNGTDLSMIAGTDVSGMDFAFVRGLHQYHTPRDSIEHQDPRSIQHQGGNLLALVRAFGTMDLDALAEPDRTYFNAGSSLLVHYPARWTLPLAAAVLLIVLTLVVIAVRRLKLRVGRVLASTAAAVVAIGAASAAAQIGWRLLAGRSAAVRWDPYRLFYDSGLYLLAFCCLGLAIVAVVQVLLARFASASEVAAGPLLLTAACGLGAALYVPGAAYLVVWPVAGGAAALACRILRPEMSPRGRALVLGLAAAPALLLVLPWVDWLEVAMTFRMVAGSVGLLAFVAVLLTPQCDFVWRRLGLYGIATLAFVGVGVLGYAVTRPEFNGARQRADQMLYLADIDAGLAWWASPDPEVDAWTAQFLGDEPVEGPLPEFGLGRVLSAPAPWFPVEAPAVEVVEDVRDGASRRLLLRLRPVAGVLQTTVESLPGSVAIDRAVVNGEWALDADSTAIPGRVLRFFGAPAGGFLLDLAVPAEGVVRLRVRTAVSSLPLVPPTSRAPDTMSRGDLTMAQAAFVF